MCACVCDEKCNPAALASIHCTKKVAGEGAGGLLEITYPEDDSVLSLEYGDELVSAGNFGLVQWPKSTQHLDIAFRVRISHRAATNSGCGSKG